MQTHDDLQVTAVSLATPVFLLFMSVGTVFGIGGTSVLSHVLGEGRRDYAKAVKEISQYKMSKKKYNFISRSYCTKVNFQVVAHQNSEQIKHTVQIDFFSDMELILRLCHIVKQKFKYQSTSKTSALDFEVGKSHWKINVLYIVYSDEAWICHCF